MTQYSHKLAANETARRANFYLLIRYNPAGRATSPLRSAADRRLANGRSEAACRVAPYLQTARTGEQLDQH